MYDDNFSLADDDWTHVLQLGFVYELPFRRTTSPLAARSLGGWQVNGIAAWYSGTPFSVLAATPR